MVEYPTEEEILDAIQRSGYLLEQEVASKLESIGYRVQTNCAYQDLDTDESREIDLVATQHIFTTVADIGITVHLICECKNNKNCFVFLGRNKNPTEYDISPEEYILPINYYFRQNNAGAFINRIPVFRYLNLFKYHYYYTQNFKAVQFSIIKRDKDKWVAVHDQFYDAFLYPIIKALIDLKNLEYREIDYKSYHKEIHLFFPLIILNSDIFYLDTTSESRKLEKRNNVTFTRTLRSKKIDGTYIIDFVNVNHLEEFINTNIKPFVDEIVDIAVKRPQVFYMDNLDQLEDKEIVDKFLQDAQSRK